MATWICKFAYNSGLLRSPELRYEDMIDFQSFVGQVYGEQEFYELMLFEIEENLEQYLKKNVHFYFDRSPDGKIQIVEVGHFQNFKEMDQCNRAIIEKREWFELCENEEHCNWWFCRLDRTGTVSSIFHEKTYTSPWKHGWADEYPGYDQPMTEEELRRGIMELCGVFEEATQSPPIRPKKSI